MALELGDQAVGQFIAESSSKAKKKRNKKTAQADKSDPIFNLFEGDRKQAVAIRSSSTGRSLVALKELPLGFLFFRESPIATIGHSKTICCICHNLLNDRSISDDILPFDGFCSRDCLTLAKTRYGPGSIEAYCNPYFTSASSSHNCDNDLLRMVIRVLSWELDAITPHCSISSELDSNPQLIGTSKIFFDDGIRITSTLAGLNLLESRTESQSPDWLSSVKNAITALLRNVPIDLLTPLAGWISSCSDKSANHVSPLDCIMQHSLELAAKINTNAYGIEQISPSHTPQSPPLSTGAIGFGLFPAVGLCVNHSCLPNSAFTFTGGHMEYRTIAAVPAGSELTVSYMNTLGGAPARLKDLQRLRHFTCSCSACSGAIAAANALRSRCAIVADAVASLPDESRGASHTSGDDIGLLAPELEALMLEEAMALGKGSKDSSNSKKKKKAAKADVATEKSATVVANAKTESVTVASLSSIIPSPAAYTLTKETLVEVQRCGLMCHACVEKGN